jgi:flavin reductase (DIM6/NTAB) family NADH-FMN oxidoreductase RutF
LSDLETYRPTHSKNTIAEITSDEFKAAFRNHPGGVAVVTADIGNGPVGLTATSVISANVEPNILAFSVSALSSSTPTLRQADTVVVHLLSARELHFAQLCATSGIDRFADTTQWSRLATGEPYFHEVKTWLRGKVIDTMDAGASAILAVEALQAAPSLSKGNDEAGEPLVYHNRTWHTLNNSSQI